MAGPKSAKQPHRFAKSKSPISGAKGTGKSGMFPSKEGNMLKMDKDDSKNTSSKKRK